MTPTEIVAEFKKDEISRTFNKTVVKDAFIVGYGIMRDRAIPKTGEQLGTDLNRITTFRLEDLPGLTHPDVKELSNLGFWLDFDTNRIYYRL
jgi:hypothetical protein